MTPDRFNALYEALSALRVGNIPAGEYDLHALVARQLTETGFSPRHEYRLGPRCRVDFLVEDVALEIKKGRPVTRELCRQLARYCASGEVTAVIVITQRSVPLPAAIRGKPVTQLALNRLWGVAL